MAFPAACHDPVLDVPAPTAPEPGAYLRAALNWHFGADTGSPFWLRIAETLDFDPRVEVRSYDDLARFPAVVDQLRDAAVEDLIPRGYGCPAPVPKVFESGGTTGAPKRTAQLPDWVEQVTRWQVEDFSAGGFVADAGLLALVPGGPHGVGHFDRAVAERLGAPCHTVDLDPPHMDVIPGELTIARSAAAQRNNERPAGRRWFRSPGGSRWVSTAMRISPRRR